MKLDIITIGDAFEDVLILPTDLKVKEDHSYTTGLGVSFELGEKIPLKEVDYEIGGSACNTAVGFARLGLKAGLNCMVGDDTPAEKIISRLKEENVDTSNVDVSKKMKTNFSVIFRLNQGRTIFIYHGLKDYSALRLKKSLNTKWFFLAPVGEGVGPLVSDLIAQVSEKNAYVAWNPGAIQIKEGASKYRHLLKNIKVLFLNREESIKFLDYPVRPSDEEVLKKLHSMGPEIVVITNGKHGAKAYDGTNYYSAPVINRTVRVDSTGAGDSFTVGFLCKLISSNWGGNVELDKNAVISNALKWGILNSNSVVQKIGAQSGLLTLNQMEKGLESEGLKIEIN